MKYAVMQEFTYGWDYAPWTEDEKPNFIFNSREEAQKEIDLLIEAETEAVLAGDMDEAMTQGDFMISELTDDEAAIVLDNHAAP